MIKTTIQIDGMACGMCEAHVCDTLRAAFPVKKVTASHRKGTAEMVTEEPVGEDRLHAALDPTGYRVVAVTSEEEKKKRFPWG